MKKIVFLVLCSFCTCIMQAQKSFTLKSPNGKLQTTIQVGDKLTYDIQCDGRQILSPSPVSLTLEEGTLSWGKAALARVSQKSVDEMVPSPLYRAKEIKDCYNELTLHFKQKWDVEFRAYNEGIAYRFVNHAKGVFHIASEEVDYCFPFDAVASVPYVATGDDGDYESQFFNSFENVYTTDVLSNLNKERLMFLPLVVDVKEGVKICLTESHLENYPGLYLTTKGGENELIGCFAAVPKQAQQGGHNQLQMVVTEREDYIAKVETPRSFPWRIAMVSLADKELAANNLTYLLAAPSRLEDISWIKPGKVAWDWWNDWNLDHVDFVTGINNDTYKKYIDFASEQGIEYVILDEGWSVTGEADLMQVVEEIDLPALIEYATAKNVGIILWAGYHAFNRDMENVCRHYAEMGVKGFKVDFMDRDDQEMTAFNYRAAQMCANYKLLLDFHGTHKPAGLHRTYPNVLNFEGVHGLEQMKWLPTGNNQVKYDVMIPFIRQAGGPMDYTQGAMRNATEENYYPSNSEPMSQGTRCHQLALYIILDSPLNMMCDSPSNYLREMECTEFIAGTPTVWDETIILDGEIGEYIVTARRKGNTWYVGGMTDWTERDLEVDLSFLGSKTAPAILIKDGVNAHRIARDYKREEVQINPSDKLHIHLAPGGGFVLKVDAED